MAHIYKVKYKAIKTGEESTIANNRKEAEENIKHATRVHIQGNVKVRIIKVKEMK